MSVYRHPYKGRMQEESDDGEVMAVLDYPPTMDDSKCMSSVILQWKKIFKLLKSLWQSAL